MPFSKEMILGSSGSQGASGVYSHQIQHSARFDRGDNSRLTRTFGTPSSDQKFTLSFWLKRGQSCEQIDGETGDGMIIMCKANGVDGSGAAIYFSNFRTNFIEVIDLYGFGVNSGNTMTTDNSFRDHAAFNHFVFQYDTTQSTDSDRQRFFLNGNQLNLSGGTHPNQNSNLSRFNDASAHTIGSAGAGNNSFDGYIAEMVFTDGQSYAPTNFAETSNGVWVPKDPSGLTFGNNGFYLKFGNASDLGEDSSGNDNDFTASGFGTDHQVLDSPTFGD